MEILNLRFGWNVHWKYLKRIENLFGMSKKQQKHEWAK
jgi:hypothetical protein